MQVTIDIPDDLVPRFQAVIPPPAPFDAMFCLTALKVYLAQMEFRRYLDEKRVQDEQEARQRVAQINRSLGLGEAS